MRARHTTVLDSRIAEKSILFDYDLNSRSMKTIGRIGWRCTTLNVLNGATLLDNHQGALKLACIFPIDTKVSLNRNLTVHIFRNIDEYASATKRLVPKDVAEALYIPTSFLAKILQTLARKKVISSNKGPGGGFWLTDEEKAARNQ